MRQGPPHTVDPITAQRGADIARRLDDAGWHIAQRTVEGLEWGAVEAWVVESARTPQGVRAYLTFLTDPQYETSGSAVWAVGLARQMPRSRDEAAALGTFTLRHCWRRELQSLIECLASLRGR